jgi:O-antigen ligase
VSWPAEADTGGPAGRRTRLSNVVAFGLSVFILLTYSGAWIMPLIGEATDPANSGLARNLYFPAYGATLVLLALRPRDVLQVVIREPFLVLLLAIAAGSIVWSVEPDQTQRRVIAILFTTLGGVVLGARWRWARLAEVLAVTFAILVVASLLAGLFVPSIGRMSVLFPGAWRGLWDEKNTFGGLMSFGVLFFCSAALFARKRALLWGGMAVLGLALLLLSTSKTSLVALFLGLGVFGFVLLARRGGAMAVVAVYAAVLALVTLGAALWLAPNIFLELLGKDATLTGRTKIWAGVIRQARLRPWLGYGYGAVWTETSRWGPLAKITKEAGFTAHHAHNSWLEQWLGLGWVGLSAWALYYLGVLGRAIWAVFTSRGALLMFPFLMVYTLISLTESVALVYNDLRWVLFVALASRLALPQSGPEAD